MKLRVAVVGAGFIAGNRHLPAWRTIGSKAEVVALSDLNRGLAREAAERFAIGRVYADADEMIAREHPDIVDICAPPAAHAKLAILAADHGCHALVEKPMALTLRDCDAMIQQAHRHGTRLCIAHTGLFYEPFIRARELVERGEIGGFRGVRIVISTPTDYMTSNVDHWAHKLPGGAVGETAPHAVYMSLAFLRRVASVTVDGVKLLPQYPWSRFDDYRINLIGETGISSININYATSQWMVRVDIAGTEGTLFLDLHGRSLVKIRRDRLKTGRIGFSVLGHGGQLVKETLRAGFKLAAGRTASTHERLIHAFVNSLLENTASPVSAEEGREAVRVMAMIAARLGETQTGEESMGKVPFATACCNRSANTT